MVNLDTAPSTNLGLYENLIARFLSVWVPHQQLSVDEGMIPWRGNLSFWVYNPDKPHKYGIKVYMVCDSTNGYCVKFKLYLPKVIKKPFLMIHMDIFVL